MWKRSSCFACFLLMLLILFSCSLGSPTLVLEEDHGGFLYEGDMVSLQSLVSSCPAYGDIAWSVDHEGVSLQGDSLVISSDNDFSFVLTAQLKDNPSVLVTRTFRVRKKHYGAPLFSLSSLSLREEETVSLSVTLDSAPSTEQILTVSSDGGIAFSPNRLTFTSGTYAVPQVITVRGVRDASLEDKTDNLRLTTEKGVVSALPVTVTNIDKESFGKLVVPEERLSVVEGESVTVSVRLASAPSRTQRVAVMGSGTVSVSPSFLDFSPGLYGIEQIVTVTATGVGENAGVTFSTQGDEKHIPVSVEAKEPQTQSEVFIPTDIEYIAVKDYLVLYYDVDYHIDRLSVNLDILHHPDSWTEIGTVPHCSFTNTCAFIDLTDIGQYDAEAGVKLKAEYKEKATVLEGEPAFTVEGYKVKATLGDYSEYFALSATPSTKTTNGEENACRTFRRGDETLYLTLRDTSQSRFRLSGLAPTSFAKIIETSQKKGVYYYGKLNAYYAENHDISDIRFRSEEDANDNGFDWKKIVHDATETFNLCLSDIGEHISVTDDAQCENVVTYGIVPEGWAGLCVYRKSDGFFHIYVSTDKTGLPSETRVKGTMVHEFGHLMGLADNAYAINESLMCYSRDSARVTFFQPSDIAKLKRWYDIPQGMTSDANDEDVSVLFDYPCYDDREDAADIIAEGEIVPAGTTILNFKGMHLACNLYRLKEVSPVKGIDSGEDLLFKTDPNTVLDPYDRVRVYLKKFQDTAPSLINPEQGIQELRTDS